jgi:hypothetical protein
VGRDMAERPQARGTGGSSGPRAAMRWIRKGEGRA